MNVKLPEDFRLIGPRPDGRYKLTNYVWQCMVTPQATSELDQQLIDYMVRAIRAKANCIAGGGHLPGI